MRKALVCITTNLASTEAVLEDLRACPGVDEAYMVYGVYDIVAKIHGTDINDLKKVLADGIMGTKNVNKTLSLVVVDE